MHNRVDVESKIERYIEQIAEHVDDSDTSLKQACLIAGHVVGKYDGTTSFIAEKAGKSVSSVENWAHASWLRTELLKDKENRARVHELWRDLKASKWWLALEIQKAGYSALYYLEYAHQHNSSGKDMMFEFKRDRDNGLAPLLIGRAKNTFWNLANMLIKSKDLTDDQVEAARTVMEAYK